MLKIHLGKKPIHLGAALRMLAGLSQEEAGRLLNAHRNTVRGIDNATCSKAYALAFLQAIGVGKPDMIAQRGVLMRALTGGKKVIIKSIEFEVVQG